MVVDVKPVPPLVTPTVPRVKVIVPEVVIGEPVTEPSPLAKATEVTEPVPLAEPVTVKAELLISISLCCC